jgi:RNA polymerase sigma-70 factor (ECF subfamily)
METAPALLEALKAGNKSALGDLFMLYRDRLWRMLYVRLDRRLSSRLSPDDVLQEAFLDVARRIDEYLADASVPFYVWVRFLTIQRLTMLERVHLGAKIRDVRMEARLDGTPFASPDSMAGQFVAQLTSPSQIAIRHELQTRLKQALDTMDPMDREVLALRHFEELENNEVARILGISKDAASKRHVRALGRLKAILEPLLAGSEP